MDQDKLSNAETELYDRQIRLWGIESQKKLRQANVLIIGAKGLGSEIAKNILLSGVNSLTILDDADVTEEDLQFNFLLNPKCAIGSKIAKEICTKAQTLNPLVKLTSDITSPSDKPSQFFSQFTIIVATGIYYDFVIKLDNICRHNNIKFIYGDNFGLFGFFISDFGNHKYYEDFKKWKIGNKRNIKGEAVVVKREGEMNFPPLNKVIVLPNSKKEIPVLTSKAKPRHLFVCMLMLIEFKKRYERYPDWKQKDIDISDMKKIVESIKEIYKSTNVTLDDAYELLFGTVAPVCSILGGIMAQEVIKAVSQKEVPINNIFLFDHVTYNGKEFTIGAN